MGRDNESKTSSVHFLRFEFTRPMIFAFRDAAPVAIAIEHPGYKVRIDEIDPRIQAALARDFSA